MNFPEHSSHDRCATTWSYYPACALPHRRFGLFPGRSPLLGESLNYFLFLQVLRCFSSLRSPHQTNMVMTGLQPDGLSHSEILGSRVICTYPRLIAAYHVLHRLREPRHPPDALTFFRHFSAHTFSCKLRVLFSTQFLKLKVFTYSLVCQYVKDLSLRGA